MAKGDAVPSVDEVTRWIKPSHLGKDDDGNVILDKNGTPAVIVPAAFSLKPDEESLSLTWLQFFAPDRGQHLPLAAEAFRNSIPSKKISDKSVFAIGMVEKTVEAGKKHGNRLRILHDPCDGNDGHCEIRRYPVELGLLQLELAEIVFAERHLYSTIK